MISATMLDEVRDQAGVDASPSGPALSRLQRAGMGAWTWMDACAEPMLAFERDSVGAWRVLEGNAAARRLSPGKALAGALLLDVLVVPDVAMTREALHRCWQRGEAASIGIAGTASAWQIWPLSAQGPEASARVCLLRVSQTEASEPIEPSAAQTPEWVRALTIAQRRVRGVYEQAALWCFEEDIDGDRVLVNPQAMQALGLDRPELAWPTLLQSVDQEDRRRFEDIRRERRRVRGPYALEARFLVSESFIHNADLLGHEGSDAFQDPSVQGLAGVEGEVQPDVVRWMLVRSVPRYDTHGEFDGYVSVAIDIHDRKQLEIDLVDLNTSLEKRVKARTVDLEAFTYSVSHDLRAPVRAIGQFVRLLREREGTQLSDESRHLMSRVLSNVERMGGQIDNLLRFSHATVGAITRLKVDMQELAGEVVDRLRPGRQNLDVLFKPMPAAYVDPVLIQEVWESLIDNAIKYSRNRPVSRLEIGHNGAAYYVRDNGIGFDPERVSQLFDVFRRLHNDPSFEGQGVGLAVARRVVERHGGRIWAESTPDQGACFYFTLPG